MHNNGYETTLGIRAIMMAGLEIGNPDIVVVGPTSGSCIINRHRGVRFGVDEFPEGEFTNTATIASYLLPPVAPGDIAPDERGKIAYLGACAGCHTYEDRMIWPPVKYIQALYVDQPKGLAEYIANPVKKREDSAEMPRRDYLDPATRLAVAEYMLSVDR